MNYVFYVSDLDRVNDYAFSYKMGTERDIAYQMSSGLRKCVVKKYTEYAGEYIDGDSVGVVFPARRWGISFAVNAFLQSLRVKKGTYIYAVAVGECISGRVCTELISSIKSLEQFKRAFSRRFSDMNKDIYVRCTDRARTIEDTEYNRLGISRCDGHIRCILNGLLYHSLAELEQTLPMKSEYSTSKKTDTVHISDIRRAEVVHMDNGPDMVVREKKENDTRRDTQYVMRKLTNIFLDDDIFAEDKLCRVI